MTVSVDKLIEQEEELLARFRNSLDTLRIKQIGLECDVHNTLNRALECQQRITRFQILKQTGTSK